MLHAAWGSTCFGCLLGHGIGESDVSVVCLAWLCKWVKEMTTVLLNDVLALNIVVFDVFWKEQVRLILQVSEILCIIWYHAQALLLISSTAIPVIFLLLGNIRVQVPEWVVDRILEAGIGLAHWLDWVAITIELRLLGPAPLLTFLWWSFLSSTARAPLTSPNNLLLLLIIIWKFSPGVFLLSGLPIHTHTIGRYSNLPTFGAGCRLLLACVVVGLATDEYLMGSRYFWIGLLQLIYHRACVGVVRSCDAFDRLFLFEPTLRCVVHFWAEATHVTRFFLAKEEIMVSYSLPANHLFLSGLDIRWLIVIRGARHWIITWLVGAPIGTLIS